MNKRITRRIIASILAFVLFFEPIALQIVKAEELPQPTVIDENIDGLMEPDEILAPHDYLDEMLNFRGHNQEEVELRAWGEWQSLINSSYLVIDEGATDVFGLYDTLSIMKDVKSTTCDVGGIIQDVAKYAHMAAAFMDKITHRHRACVALTCWTRMSEWTNKALELTKSSKTLDFLTFCCPPKSWHNVKEPANGMDSYWHWIQKKGGKDVDTELTNAQGIARSIGIGFAVIGTVLATWNYINNEDRSVGRWSYNRVKDIVAAGLAAAGLVAMFCIPVVGQVLAIVTAIWGVVTFAGDLIGKYNKKWKDAYKCSYWFLYENDPEFKIFYDNRELLSDNEKSASLNIVEKNYADFKVEKAIEGTDEDDPEAETKARNSRIYMALEKQGVLTSYYNKSGFKMPDYSPEKLMELWSAKASFMAWKPTEAETNKKKTFWTKLGAVFNPETYISWAANKIASRDYNKLVEDGKIEKVYFNPDYVLIKKYIQYLTANNIKDEAYNGFGLRIEQSPFNYIPLLAIDIKDWNEDLFKEAFAADSFIVAQKEMTALHNQIELAAQSLDNSLDEVDEMVNKLAKKVLPNSTEVREFLDDFAEAYANKPNDENKKLFKAADKFIGLDWDKSKKKTPANILECVRGDIEKALLYEPLSMSQKGAEMVLLTITVKQQLDMGALMQTYVSDKWESLNSFDKDFKNPEIKKYLKDGSFLDVKGGGFLDWLAELYSAYDESEKTLKKMEEDVNEYCRLAGISASGERKTWVFFTKSVSTPRDMVHKINAELSNWKKTIKAWNKISSDANVRVVLAEDEEFAKKVLSSYDISKFKLLPLDPEDEGILEVEVPLCAADSSVIEGAAAEFLE